MKRQFVLVLALCLLLSGCSVLVTPDSGRKTELVQGSETPEAFSKLVIDADVADVTIACGDGWRVEYALPVAPEITLADGALTILDKTKTLNIIRNTSPTIRVTVPQDTKLEAAQITVDVGNVKAEKLEIAALTVKIDTGDTDLEDLVTTGVSVETDVGNVELDRVTADRIDVSVDTGDIELDLPGTQEDYAMELTTDVGNVEVGGRDQGTKYSGPVGGKTVTASTDVGEIEVEFD